MTRPQYQLVAIDLDGTAMGEDLVIPEANRIACRAAQAAGVKIVLATGRVFAASKPYADQLGVTGYLICYQGALIRHSQNGEVLHHVTMPVDATVAALRLISEHDLLALVFIGDRVLMDRPRPELDLYLSYHPEGINSVIEPDLAGAVRAEAPTKIVIVAESTVVVRQVALIREQFPGQLAAARSAPNFGELTAPGVNKGHSLAILAEHLGIPREQVLAIGDQENDLTMVSWAGFGVAVENAVPAVKDAAKAIAPRAESGGVAWAIERFVIPERS